MSILGFTRYIIGAIKLKAFLMLSHKFLFFNLAVSCESFTAVESARNDSSVIYQLDVCILIARQNKISEIYSKRIYLTRGGEKRRFSNGVATKGENRVCRLLGTIEFALVSSGIFFKQESR